MLLMELIIPLTMAGLGSLFVKQAPRQINPVFGYRSARSMKNRETWEFAHRYSGRLWRLWGRVLFILSLFVMLPVRGCEVDTVGMAGGILSAVQVIFLIGVIFPTEAALKKNFDENGIRRHIDQAKGPGPATSRPTVTEQKNNSEQDGE